MQEHFQEHFKELFEYNHHSNQNLIVLISEKHQNISEKTIRLMHHLINAQQIWNARIAKEKQFDVWQMNNWNRIAKIDIQNHSKTLALLEAMDLNCTITYLNTKGVKFSNTVKDILFHIINHSTYHRAQIAADLKQNGIEPINTDYIFYKRKTE